MRLAITQTRQCAHNEKIIICVAKETSLTYKKRCNGTTRAFGGINLVMCGDFWQLHPVSGIFLASDFTEISPGRARDALTLFWEDGRDSIRNFWELTELMRCDDIWYNTVLEQCRGGCLSLQQYCYFHGLPTLTSPCEDCTCNNDVVQDKIIGPYRKAWEKEFLNGHINI